MYKQMLIDINVEVRHDLVGRVKGRWGPRAPWPALASCASCGSCQDPMLPAPAIYVQSWTACQKLAIQMSSVQTMIWIQSHRIHV